jgi:ABC-2 type transport system ATP-binding protein
MTAGHDATDRRDTDATAGAVAVSLSGVTKHYGTVEALRGLTFEVARGEMFGLIGPDGAGKTTAIRAICGLLRADAGKVRVFGRDPVHDHREITARVGYLSQRFSLYGDLSIDENIAFFAEIHGLHDYAVRRDELLSMTQLTPFRGRLADRLSGGMKQKLALACTLIHRPELIVLDEPTTGVDPVSRREFWKLLSECLADGITILMSTPYLDEAERCARVALVHEGRVLALDAPANLRAQLPGRMLEIIVSQRSAVLTDVRALPGVADAHLFGERLHVRLAGDADEAVARFDAARARTPLAALPMREIVPTLEDVFIAQLAGKETANA